MLYIPRHLFQLSSHVLGTIFIFYLDLWRTGCASSHTSSCFPTLFLFLYCNSSCPDYFLSSSASVIFVKFWAILFFFFHLMQSLQLIIFNPIIFLLRYTQSASLFMWNTPCIVNSFFYFHVQRLQFLNLSMHQSFSISQESDFSCIYCLDLFLHFSLVF